MTVMQTPTAATEETGNGRATRTTRNTGNGRSTQKTADGRSSAETGADLAGGDACAAPPRHPRPDGQDSYTISEVVAFTGLTAHTLRWYERIGLMAHVDRSHTGQRRYTNRDLDWLDLVGKLRLTGMPVADMVRYAELVRAGESTYGERYALLESTRRDVLSRIAELRDTLAVLDRKLSFYAEAGRPYEAERAGRAERAG